MSNNTKWYRMAALLALLPVAACSDVLTLDVEAPGRIADEDLNTIDAVPGLVAGMEYNLTRAVDAISAEVFLAGGEIGHGGSYDFGAIPVGRFKTLPQDWNGSYGAMQRSRWTAEATLPRIEEILGSAAFEKNASVAKAYLMAGFSDRLMGEVQCRVNYDNGPDLAHTDAFARADSMFTRAIAVGTAANQTSIVNAAYGGRASVRAWMGQWDAAAADAAKVSTTFAFKTAFSTAYQSYIQYETNYRREFTIYGTMWADVTDPRVPFDKPVDSKGQPLKGQDGQTLFYHQLKYVDPTDDIPLTHGAEMRVLQAEAALRKSDYAAAEDFLNQARAKWGMAPLTLSHTPSEAWATLRFERAATLWLEARRMWDLRRWAAEGAPMKDTWIDGRDSCFPISENEGRANPQISTYWGGCPTCG